MRASRKEYMKEWNERNKEKRKEYARLWNIKNREKRRLFNKKYREMYPERNREQVKAWRLRNLQYVQQFRANKSREFKLSVLAHYCEAEVKCVRCGFQDIRALSIDHINGKGRQHRNQVGATHGRAFYNWLKENNFPIGYQVLCMNCNWIKRFENKELYVKR